MSGRWVLTGEQRSVLHNTQQGPKPIPVFRKRWVDNSKYQPKVLVERAGVILAMMGRMMNVDG